ncbi:MAG: hypothetical protein JRN62_03540 [Nitrososphaerota archaeon]|jgi:hypothetical protein|nr:hypothetical protein [Nitrososphaerota archaeon]MDG6948674.1 hypothetical protein [Nitrososphaerota archaeon]
MKRHSGVMKVTNSEPKQKYYVPETPKVEALDLGQGDINLDDTLKSIVNENGLIKTELEADVVLTRIAKDIYKNRLAGFRETYANAITACQVAAEMFKCTPSIEVTLDKDTRMLRIKEIDSMGVSPEAFKDIYRFIGRTGNADGKRLGQFGFGRIAWVALSDRMIFETKYRTQDGRVGEYAMENKEGLAFSPIKTSELGTFGTTLTFFLYENVDLDTLESYIRTAGELAPVDTTFRMVSGGIETSQKLSKTPEAIIDDVISGANNATKLSTELLTYKDAEVEIYAKLAVAKYWQSESDEWSQYNHAVRCTPEYRLLGMPIDCNIGAGPFSSLLVNILDERKYRPTADRDRLREDDVVALQEKLSKLFSQMVSAKLSMSTLNEYMALPKEWKLVLNIQYGRLPLPSSLQIADIVTTMVSIRGLSDANKLNLGHILNTIPKERLFFILNGSPGHYLPKVRSHVPDAVAIIVHSETMAKALKEYGVRDLKEFGKGTSIATTGPADFVVYTCDRNKWRERVPKKDLPPTTIKIPGQKLLEGYTRRVGRFSTDYIVTRDMKYLDGIGITLGAFMRKVATKVVATSEGNMCAKDIPTSMVPVLCVYDLTDAAPLIFKSKEASKHGAATHNKPPVIGILGDANTIFEVMFYLEEKGRTFELDVEGTATARARMGDDWFPSGHFYEHNLAVLHVYLMCKDEGLRKLLQIAIDESSNYKEMVPRRAKALEVIARLAKN